MMKESMPMTTVFRYCPACGSSDLEMFEGKSISCKACGLKVYDNAAAATVAVIQDTGGRLLVAVRGREPARGTWDLPGGFCDHGESAERGIVREVKEETGLDVRQTRFLFSLPNVYPFGGIIVHTVDLFFRCTVDHPETARAMDDAARLQWVRWEDVDPARFGLPSIRRGMELLLMLRRR